MGVLHVPEICSNYAVCGGRLRNYDFAKPYMLRCTRKGSRWGIEYPDEEAPNDENHDTNVPIA